MQTRKQSSSRSLHCKRTKQNPMNLNLLIWAVYIKCFPNSNRIQTSKELSECQNTGQKNRKNRRQRNQFIKNPLKAILQALFTPRCKVYKIPKNCPVKIVIQSDWTLWKERGCHKQLNNYSVKLKFSQKFGNLTTNVMLIKGKEIKPFWILILTLWWIPTRKQELINPLIYN